MSEPETVEINVGEVWEHRHFCLLCNTAKKHRHRYVVTKVLEDRDDLVMVRDLTPEATLPIGDAYTTSRDRFGSFAKGGLRLAGHRGNGRFVALKDLDERIVEHSRVPPRSTYRVPRTAAAGAMLA